MGRQLPIIATPLDERLLLAYVQTLSPIRVFVSHGSSIEDLWIDDWEQRDIQEFQFKVWLQNFPWEPEYRQTGGPQCPKKNAGLWYISNSHTAPVIEICRSWKGGLGEGRIYWGKDFSAPNGLAYDVDTFSKCVDRIWRWIRRNGHRMKSDYSTHPPYCLPDGVNQMKLLPENPFNGSPTVE